MKDPFASNSWSIGSGESYSSGAKAHHYEASLRPAEANGAQQNSRLA